MFNKIRFTLQIISRYSNWMSILQSLYSKKSQDKVELRNGVTLVGSERSTLLAIADEIFFDNVYTPKPLRIRQDAVVVDIGANIGVFVAYARWCGAKKIDAYEPFPENVKLIKRNNVESSGLKIHQQAVSGTKGKAKLYTGDVDAGNLLFDHNIHGKLHNFIEVSTTTLTDIVKDNNLKKIDFLKIDCEGSEGEIISSTSKKIWDIIDQVSMEYHDNVSTLSHVQIAKKLQTFGFKTKTKHSPKSPFGYIYAWKE